MKLNVLMVSGLLVFAILTSCSSVPFRYEEGMAWNTLYHITYQSDRDFSDSIIMIFEEIDSSLSPFNGESTVSKINDNRSNKVDSHFIAVYNKSREINHASEGNFDPTLAPLIKAWGFGQGHSLTSDTLRIDSLLDFVGIDKTELRGLMLSKTDPRVEFNFSALAKGYGVDCIAEMLERNGVENFLIEIGGEIRTQGINSHGEEWVIGIDRPEADISPGETVFNIRMRDGSIATSGNYRNFHEAAGTRFGHTISPSTGRPIQTDIISATIVAHTCMEADAIATACMVGGTEEALNLCARMRVAVMLIRSDMSVVANAAFRSLAGESWSLD